MSGFHNVFYYYSGSQQPDRSHDRQLENNTTKALINTLEHCSPLVARRFLAWLGIEATEPVRYELQRTTISKGIIGNKSQRLLLGLVPSEEGKDFCIEEKDEVEGDSLPDAWLFGSDYVVLIESKVAGSLEQEQMQKHRHKLCAGRRQRPGFKVHTWAEIHRFFKTLPDDALTDIDRWIVGQFTQYLEWIGMAEFLGFEQGMFDYFVAHPDDRDESDRRWIRSAMQSLAKRVAHELRDLDSSFYQECYVGLLKRQDDHCWAAFGPKEFKERAHQTMALYAYGLDIFVNVELKQAADRLKRKIRRDHQTFRQVVSSIPASFSVQLEERIQKQASLYDYRVIARLEGGDRDIPHPIQYGLKDPQLGQFGFDYIERLLEEIDLPYFSVRKRIDSNFAIELSQGDGRRLINKMVSIMKELHPLVEYIEQ
jgi:hypothetical protein